MNIATGVSRKIIAGVATRLSGATKVSKMTGAASAISINEKFDAPIYRPRDDR